MGLFDFLKRNKKNTKSPEEQLFEALKMFEKQNAYQQETGNREPVKDKKQNAYHREPEKQVPEKPEKPVYNEEARIKEVSGIRDDQKLIEIINANKDTDAVIKTAIGNLSDQKLLVKAVERTRILNKYSDMHLRTVIISRVTDQETLFMIGNHEQNPNIRKAIASRITDHGLIKSLLMSDENINSDIADAFMNRIQDQNELAELYRNAPREPIRHAAFLKISDKTILKEIIQENPIQYTYMIGRLKENGMEDLAGILEDIKEKDSAAAKIGGYICRSCGGENLPEDGKISCICKHCGAENHDWEFIDNVREYRDYAVGSTYYECKRCKAQKDYRTVDTGYLE